LERFVATDLLDWDKGEGGLLSRLCSLRARAAKRAEARLWRRRAHLSHAQAPPLPRKEVPFALPNARRLGELPRLAVVVVDLGDVDAAAHATPAIVVRPASAIQAAAPTTRLTMVARGNGCSVPGRLCQRTGWSSTCARWRFDACRISSWRRGEP
jgi:hypothetical protein